MTTLSLSPRRLTLSVVASIAIILLLAVSLVYYSTEESAPSITSESIESSGSYASSQAESSSTKTPQTSLGMAGLANCSAREEAFLDEGKTYSQLGYPKLIGDSDNPINALSPAFVYFVQFRGQGQSEITLGDVQVPMISACQALGDAIASLGINSSDYRLAQVAMNDGEVNVYAPVSDPTWTFYFARLYQGYEVEGTVNDFSAGGVVNSVSGSVGHRSVDALSLSPLPQNYTLNVNSSQALQIVRHTTKMNQGPALVANGTVQSIDLRLVQVNEVAPGSYTAKPVNASTPMGEIRLVWEISTSAPNYVGYFWVDAENGQVLGAEGESTLPCGGAQNCGIVYSKPSGVISTPLFGDTKGLDISTESFEIDGTAVGLNGTYSVLVPHVISMRSGSSGSIGLNLTGIASTCTSNSQLTCVPFPYNVTLRATGIPQGVSITYANQSAEVAMGASVVAEASITALSASPGTYVVFFDTPPYTAYGGYVILSVWNSRGQWPVLPMLDVPLANGDNQPVLVNGTAIFTYTVTRTPSYDERVEMTGSKANAVAVDQVRNLVFTETWPLNGFQGGGVGVSVVSGANDSILGTIEIPNASLPADSSTMAFNPNNDQLYVAVVIADSGRLFALDTVSMRVVGSISVPAQAVAYDSVTNMIYVCQEGANGLYVVNASTLELATIVGSTVELPGSFDYSGAAVAVNPVTNTVYEATNGTLNVIDGSTNKISATVHVSEFPDAIAVDSKTNTVYVANHDSRSVSVIDGGTNQVIATIPVGVDPNGVAVNPNTNMVFVSDSGNDSLVVIDAATNKPLYALPTGAGPSGVAVNVATGLVYVSDEGAIAEINVLRP